MRYEVLGPLRIIGESGGWTVSAAKPGLLLGALLLRADHLLSREQLIGELWGERQPARPDAGVHVYISQLRKHFARHGASAEHRLVTEPGGYQLNLGSDTLDFKDFLRLLGAGRVSVRDRRYDRAIDVLTEAMALWRGPLLGNERGGPIVNGFGNWLAEARIECAELQVEAQLELGLHREAIGRLYTLVADHPLREGFYRQLMLAQYRSGFRAEALKTYRSARERLREELGIEPSRELRGIQVGVLNADPRLELAGVAA